MAAANSPWGTGALLGTQNPSASMSEKLQWWSVSFHKSAKRPYVNGAGPLNFGFLHTTQLKAMYELSWVISSV